MIFKVSIKASPIKKRPVSRPPCLHAITSATSGSAFAQANLQTPIILSVFAQAKMYQRKEGLYTSARLSSPPLPIRYISSFFYKNSETLPGFAQGYAGHGREIGMGPTLF